MPFTGRATYDPGAFEGVAEDVSGLVSIISPFETPLLAALGDSQFPATNTLHEWVEDELSPNSLVLGGGIAATGASATVGINGGLARYVQVGALLQAPDASIQAGQTTPELMQITQIVGNTITVTRAFAGTTQAALNSGDSLTVVADAALEGADVTMDTSRSRIRKGNYTMIFKKDVIVSGTVRSVNQLGGISDEWDYQIQKKLRENLRDLEKAVILSRLSGNTLGSASAIRTFAGLLQQINTNNPTAAINLTASTLTAEIKKAWDQGGTDIDLIVCGDKVKNVIDNFNDTRIQVVQGTGEDFRFRNLVSVFECTYGSLPLMLTRWMPPTRYMIVSTQRIAIAPLQGRSFQFEEVARTGDSNKGMLLGEYTLEVRNEAGMVQGRISNP